MEGNTIALYGDSGSGKTTQLGEYAKYVRKNRGLNSVLFTSDLGGYDSIKHLINLGVVQPIELDPQNDDPWIWINDAVEAKGIDLEKVGCVMYDSATSQSEALLTACHKADFQIGQQRTQKFTVSKGKQNLNVSINNEAHYGVVQGFMLDAIWKSTWLSRRGTDVIWTFSVHRGEEQDRTPILGPKLAGKALTAAIPKWFKYTFRIASIPQDGEAPRHVLYLAEHPELAGLGHSFGNARYPIQPGVDPLPASIEPASMVKAIELIERGQKQAEDLARQELGI